MKLNFKREAKVGLFMLIMLIALYWGFNFLKGKDVFTSDNIYYATFSQVSGIQQSSAVKINGFKIGSVSKMQYDPTVSDKITVTFSIKSKYKIPTDSRAEIFLDGLMGGKAIEIVLGEADTYIENKGTISTVNAANLEGASEFDQLKQMGLDLVNELQSTLESVNTLIKSNSESINTTMNNVSTLSGSLNGMVASERKNIESMIDNLNTLTATLSNNSERIDNIVNNVDNFTDSLSTANIPTMVANINTTLGELNKTLEMVNKGEGSAGKFMKDEALYNSLTSASSNLSLLLNDLQENPKRYVHFSLFGKKDKE